MINSWRFFVPCSLYFRSFTKERYLGNESWLIFGKSGLNWSVAAMISKIKVKLLHLISLGYSRVEYKEYCLQNTYFLFRVKRHTSVKSFVYKNRETVIIHFLAKKNINHTLTQKANMEVFDVASEPSTTSLLLLGFHFSFLKSQQLISASAFQPTHPFPCAARKHYLDFKLFNSFCLGGWVVVGAPNAVSGLFVKIQKQALTSLISKPITLFRNQYHLYRKISLIKHLRQIFGINCV